MPQIINTNIPSLTAQRNLNSSQGDLQTSLQRLSSGLRVNSAKDDAAGLAIAERQTSQIRGTNVAIRNANDGISLSQTAEGAIGSVSENFQRMRELAVQSANGTYSDAEGRANLDQEYQALAAEVDRVLADTRYNGLNILGADAGATQYQIGANATDILTVTTTNLAGDADITAATGSDVTTQANATAAIGLLDTAIQTVTSERASYGATQSRFESIVTNLQISAENESAARSRIMDADFAAETAELTRAQILQQAGVSILSQANALPQNVLALLQ
jgi:flagellin